MYTRYSSSCRCTRGCWRNKCAQPHTHTSAYVSIPVVARAVVDVINALNHTHTAYVGIRQHTCRCTRGCWHNKCAQPHTRGSGLGTQAWPVSIRHHTSAYVRRCGLPRETHGLSAYASIRQHTWKDAVYLEKLVACQHTSAYVRYVSIRQKMRSTSRNSRPACVSGVLGGSVCIRMRTRIVSTKARIRVRSDALS